MYHLLSTHTMAHSIQFTINHIPHNLSMFRDIEYLQSFFHFCQIFLLLWIEYSIFVVGCVYSPRGGCYSHTLGIYGCVTLIGRFMKMFAPMMGACFLSNLSPIMGTFLAILPSMRVKNKHFSPQMAQFLPIMVVFSANFVPMMGTFFLKVIHQIQENPPVYEVGDKAKSSSDFSSNTNALNSQFLRVCKL